jgi:DHA2 family multidrug resistance protein
LRGFAQQFVVAPAVTLTLGSLAPERLKFASGLFNLMRNLGGAIGIAVCGTLLNSRTNLHFERLASHLTTANPALTSLLAHSTAVANAASADGVHAHTSALAQLWSLTLREAQTQAYADAFLAITCAFVIATLMVPIMRKVVAPATPQAQAH